MGRHLESTVEAREGPVSKTLEQLCEFTEAEMNACAPKRKPGRLGGLWVHIKSKTSQATTEYELHAAEEQLIKKARGSGRASEIIKYPKAA